MKGGQDKPSVRGCNADNPSPRLEVVVREYAKGRSVCVCVPLGITGILLVFLTFTLTRRGVEQACRAPQKKALCSVLRISLETSSDVPACSDLTIPNGP